MIADITEIATKAGTWPMQVLLLVGIIILGLVFRMYYKDTQTQVGLLLNKIDAREAAMTSERLARINSLMEILRDDTRAKESMASAVGNNTEAISNLKDFIRDQQQQFRATLDRLDKR